MADLTDKQQAFVEHYLACWNATEAARRAGYSDPNRNAHRLMVNNGIQAVIQERLKAHQMSADEVLQRLATIARGEMTDFVTADGGPVQLDLRKAAQAGKLGLLKSFKRDARGTVTIELHDPVRALELIGKHHALFTEKTEHSGQVDIQVKAYANVSPDEWDTTEG